MLKYISYLRPLPKSKVISVQRSPSGRFAHTQSHDQTSLLFWQADHQTALAGKQKTNKNNKNPRPFAGESFQPKST